MKILVAPDSFKESLSAKQAAYAIERGIKNALPDADIERLPMADGGEGSMQILVEHTKGNLVNVAVCDSLLRPIIASYGVLGDGETVVVESASTIGFAMLKKEDRNPFRTSSYGLGLLIRHVIESGYRKIIACIGGTSTNDGGAGMLQALGCKLNDSNGEPIGVGNAALANLHSMDIAKMQDLLDGCELILASDVVNTLLGNNGATYTYARQKGAKDEDLPLLEVNLSRYAEVVAQTLGKDYSGNAGAGAAGGIGFALMALMEAKMQKGAELVMDLLNMEAFIADVDLVITGEGSLDSQTSFGKVIHGVVSLAKKHGKPAIAICGSKLGSMADLRMAGLTAAFSIVDSPMTLKKAMNDAAFLLEKQTEEVMRLLSTGVGMARKS